MTRVVVKVFVAGWLGVSAQLCAATLWSGLQDPPPDQAPGILVGTGTVLGFHFQPQTDLKLQGFVGYIGLPAPALVGFHASPLPNFEFDLWEGTSVLGPELPALTGVSLMRSLGKTESGLPFWYVACDISNLPWTLQKGHEYTLTISPTVACEWLVNSTVPDPYVVSVVGPSANLSSLSPSSGWNARLDFVPVPEANAGGLVAIALLGFAGWRRFLKRSARA